MKDITGHSLIAAERQRQITVEGWSESHDDFHGAVVLERAAECYMYATCSLGAPPSRWPFSPEWWKPKDRQRNLERAGALYQAAADVAGRAGDHQRREQLLGGVTSCAWLLDGLISSATVSTNRAEYCYSWNGEDFKSGTFDSVKAALDDAVADNDGEHTHVYIGQVERPSNSCFFPDAGDLLEHMDSQAYDYAGEYSADYLDVSDEAKAELNELLSSLLDSWCRKHGVSPSFYQVGNVKEYPLPAMTK